MFDLDEAKKIIEFSLADKLGKVEFKFMPDEDRLQWRALKVEINGIDVIPALDVEIKAENDCGLVKCIFYVPLQIVNMSHQALYWVNEYNRSVSPLDFFAELVQTNDHAVFLLFEYHLIVTEENFLKHLGMILSVMIDYLPKNQTVQNLLALTEETQEESNFDEMREAIESILDEKIEGIEFAFKEGENSLTWEAENAEIQIGNFDVEADLDISIDTNVGFIDCTVYLFYDFKIEHQTLYWLNEFNRNSSFFRASLKQHKNAENAYLVLMLNTPASIQPNSLEFFANVFCDEVAELAENDALHHLIDLIE